MNIVKIAALKNGAHENRNSNNIMAVPDGWAMIPDGFPVPDSFPFVNIEANTVEHIREAENADGEKVIRTVKMMTVTAMTEMPVPDDPEPEPTEDERRDAQIFYTAMMTDTLLEV